MQSQSDRWAFRFDAMTAQLAVHLICQLHIQHFFVAYAQFKQNTEMQFEMHFGDAGPMKSAQLCWSSPDCTATLMFKNKTIDEVKEMTGYPWGIEDESVIRCES